MMKIPNAEVSRAGQPDLTVIDLQLPGMDGSAATSLLQQGLAIDAIPVIALTALARTADREKSELSGCDAYIGRPLRFKHWCAAINTFSVKGQPRAP